MEWAEKALDMFPKEHLLVEMSYLSDTSRNLVLKPVGERYVELLSQLNTAPRTKKWSLP